MHAESTSILNHEGHAFKVEIMTDSHYPAPWEMSNTHGPVREARRTGAGYSPKRPGERPLNSPRRGESFYFYDWQAAIQTALKDGWGHPGGSEAARGLSSGQIAAAAVQADFEYLRSWLADEWHYVGVCVSHEASGEHVSLWGIESTDTAYHETVARELAGDIIASDGFKAWRERLAARERAQNLASRLVSIAADCDGLNLDNADRETLESAAETLEILAKG